MRSDTQDDVSARTQKAGSATPGSRRGALLPIAVFVALVVLLAIGLTLSPREEPLPLIGKPVPEFDLPPVKGRTLGLSSADLGRGEVSLVNVFASWCFACREEHPVLLDLKARGLVPIHGLNYKDPPDDAARWLAKWGEPYTRTGADVDGRVAIDWGCTASPKPSSSAPTGALPTITSGRSRWRSSANS